MRPLLRSGAISDPSYLWWDVRLQPKLGTVEVRIMDGQTTVGDVGALAALVQSLASLELARPDAPEEQPVEVLAENRFLAARDGMQAMLIDVDTGTRVPAGAQLKRTLALCHRHSRQLRCERELDSLRRLVTRGGAARQLAHGVGGDLREVVAGLARAYSPRRAMNALLDNGLRDEPAAA